MQFYARFVRSVFSCRSLQVIVLPARGYSEISPVDDVHKCSTETEARMIIFSIVLFPSNFKCVLCFGGMVAPTDRTK